MEGRRNLSNSSCASGLSSPFPSLSCVPLINPRFFSYVIVALSLQQYLSTLRTPRKIILVLTKVDIVGAERANAWKKYLYDTFSGVRIVEVESYKERDVLNDGRGSRKYVDPHIPENFLDELVNALKESHDELLQPPPQLAQFPEKLAKWKPKVKATINWKAVSDGQLADVIPSADALQTEAAAGEGSEEDDEVDLRYLTVGLIGKSHR